MTIQNRPEYCTREGGVSQYSRIRWRAYDALVPQIPVMLTMRYKNAWNLRIASQPVILSPPRDLIKMYLTLRFVSYPTSRD